MPLTQLSLHFDVHHGLVSTLNPQTTTTEACSPETRVSRSNYLAIFFGTATKTHISHFQLNPTEARAAP